ncbi:MAG: NUDIX domain-containing protein [Clostridiales bacterium]|nr:NUDIX domain-containing protein [Clostridiales bacterium]MCC8099472.1 NUDIX domain-containing protein [Clostridiales bacterium]
MIHSAGAVLYRQEAGARRYILVQEYNGDTGFPKGHVEPGETEEQTALREIWEETGVHATLAGPKRFQVEYTLHNGSRKQVTYFIASCTEAIRQTGEVRRALCLPYGQALARLTHPSHRTILEEAHRYLDAQEAAHAPARRSGRKGPAPGSRR